MDDRHARALMLADFASRQAASDQKRQILTIALQTARSITNSKTSARVLAEISPYLEPDAGGAQLLGGRAGAQDQGRRNLLRGLSGWPAWFVGGASAASSLMASAASGGGLPRRPWTELTPFAIPDLMIFWLATS